MTSCFRAPSWSWALCEGFVSYDGKEIGYQSQIEVLEVECSLEGANSFGQVKGGFLRISGKIFQAMLLDSTVYVLGDGEDSRTTARPKHGTDVGKTLEYNLFSPDTLLREVDGLDASGSTYRTAQRTRASLQQKSEAIVANVVCLLVLTKQRPPRGEVRCFVVLGGLSSPP